LLQLPRIDGVQLAKATFFMHSILPVVVLYNRSYKESIAIETLNQSFEQYSRNQKLTVFVYDNSSAPQKVLGFGNLEFLYFSDKDNGGVSPAYNHGAKWAGKIGKEWLLLLDQDTQLPEDFFTAANVHIKREEFKLYAPILKSNNLIISPCNYYFKKGFPRKEIKTGKLKIKNVNFLNSGLIINVEAFNKINGFNEKIPLYFSDFEFIDRLKKRYPYCFILPVTLHHNLRDLDEKSFESASKTFPFYCDGARASSKNILDFAQFFLITAGRAAILSKRYRTLHFARIFFDRFVLGKKTKS